MSNKLHPLVQKTKLDLERLDKNNQITWGERRSYEGSLLPISVEPKMRKRALRFMHDLLVLLESNGHGLKFENKRCYVEMYGELTEIKLRQKFYRDRVKGDYSYSHNIFVKSEDLEFQILGYPRKNWIDKKTKNLEDYLSLIYEYIARDSLKWAEHSRRQDIEEKKREVQIKLDENKARQIALENQKIETLVKNASNYKNAHEIRVYLKALEEKQDLSQEKDDSIQDYISWGYKRADNIDPLFDDN